MKTKTVWCKSRKSSWPDLPIDPCALILSKLSFASVLRFQAVCSQWNKAVHYIWQSSSSSSAAAAFQCIREPPLILLPQNTDDDGFRFRTSLGGKIHIVKNTPQDLLHGSGLILGSSHGWLLYLHRKKQVLELLLLNPLSGVQLPLTPLNDFPDVISYKCPEIWNNNIENCAFQFNRKSGQTPLAAGSCTLRRSPTEKKIFGKFVLSSRPTNCSTSNEAGDTKIGVLVMYNFVSDLDNHLRDCYYLAFCTTRHPYKWTKLNDQLRYMDIMSYDNQFYALCRDLSVEVWDFPDSIPVQTMKIQPHADGDWKGLFEIRRRLSWEYNKAHIVKTGEDIFLLVKRLTPLRDVRVKYTVYKLVYGYDGGTKWTHVKSIGNYAFFVSENDSMGISCSDGLKLVEDSLYFVDINPTVDDSQLTLLSFRRRGRREKVCDLPMESMAEVFLLDPNPF